MIPQGFAASGEAIAGRRRNCANLRCEVGALSPNPGAGAQHFCPRIGEGSWRNWQDKYIATVAVKRHNDTPPARSKRAVIDVRAGLAPQAF